MSFINQIAFATLAIFSNIYGHNYSEAFLKKAFPGVEDYEKTELLPQKFQGWYANAEPMRHLIKLTRPKVIIELGAWLGSSTLHIASLLPNDGLVFTVDHWYQPPYDQNIDDWYKNYDIPNLYKQFLSNVKHCGLENKIVPVFGTTKSALEEFKKHNIQPDLIYVDADHYESSVYWDLVNYYPLIKGHGVICGDDYYWNLNNAEYPVKKAVDRFAKENNLKVYTPNNWFWYLSE
jgi:predicted O-methyltransferase YrrM